MSEQNRKRGRPKGVLAEAGVVTKELEDMAVVEPLNAEDFAALKYLQALPTLSKKFERELSNPSVQKNFAGNVHLLTGLHNIPICKLAELAGCFQSTLARIVAPTPGRPTKFHKTRPLIFLGIAEVLGVTVFTLLFVDLREVLMKAIKEAETH